jgi:hypothetical protein
MRRNIYTVRRRGKTFLVMNGENVNSVSESACTCAICMDELGTSIEVCPCGHVYHSSCIREWINQKRVCPQCKGVALPLLPLHFNLFQITQAERAHVTAEHRSTLKLKLDEVLLNIENELAEINVLEPELAEAKSEDSAYKTGLNSKKRQVATLEDELLIAQSELSEIESNQMRMNSELLSMRDRLMKFDGTIERPNRRSQMSEVPKMITFLASDARKLKELERKRLQLNSNLAESKNKLHDTVKKIREVALRTPGSSDRSALVKPTIKNVNIWKDGFVPIDAISHKRKRENERIAEIENRKPALYPGITYPGETNGKEMEGFNSLADIVGLLSETEEPADTGVSGSTFHSISNSLLRLNSSKYPDEDIIILE